MTDIDQELDRRFDGVSIRKPGRVRVPVGVLPEVADFVKSRYGFTVLTCLTAVDYTVDFRLVCHLARPDDGALYTVEADINREKAVAPSLTALWRSALWQEREIYDLFGITFTGHPDLRRILLDTGFAGHPLRKDYEIRKPDGA